MKSISVLGKFLDQPKLVNKFSKSVPAILVTGGGICTFYNTYNAPKKDRKKTFLKNLIVFAGTITSAILAPKIASKLVERHPHAHAHSHCHHCHSHDHHGHSIDELISDFLTENKVSEKTAQILNKHKKILKFSEIKTIFEELNTEKGKKLLNKLIPNPEHIDSKHIFGEIKWLSLMGAIPVVGGILSGITADRFTEKDWKERVPNKIKEGSYQYLANIFLCNVGAGLALAMVEKAKIQSKAVRALGMIAGIILTGVVLGSTTANLIGKKIIDPLLGEKHKKGCLFDERKPELLDIGLHVDDIATVAVLSGLKWIEPSLPILYGISGYRAGIGYRNGESAKNKNT